MDPNNYLTIKTFMSITAERDAALRERNMALDERKRAFAERDLALVQRDAAVSELNAIIQERDEALSALKYQENSINDPESFENELPSPDYNNYTPNGSTSLRGQDFDSIEANTTSTKRKKVRQPNPKARKVSKPTRKDQESISAIESTNGWDDFEDDGENRQQHVSWKDDKLGLNQISFDDSAMPVPVCTCTGAPQPCYRWGSGGWQSACCTTTISMYPLPQVANRRYSRVGGRKMSGGAFNKLLNRLAGEGYDFSAPLDLKHHWAKHGTNRYSTLK